MSRDHAVRLLHARLTEHLSQMAESFKPGMKLTFIARRPGFPEQDVLLGDDTLDGATEVIERTRTRSPVNG